MGVQGCCGCFNLRDGSIAIGVTVLTFYILSFVFGVGMWIFAASKHSPAGQHMQPWVIAVVTTIFAIHILFNSLLVHGARKGVRGMLLAWIIYFGIVTGFQSVFGGISVYYVIISGGNTILVLSMMAVLAVLVVSWYWLAVVLSHYREMNDHKDIV
ncbi:uncharacterized protein LOC119092719 [Pollicipes pollicipes]|uniref:uncharacterized protein LOC119092719 n=1 Tax=Pollicipes pollicipes TaxID=41117 RepID=UPI001884C457|nr:uncharacterized protein LOC119092719 [Pollicipes pollicipes]